MTEKKANHQAKIVRVNDVFVHTNADSLELINIDGYQAVARKGQFKVGDLAVYIQPDSVVPQTEPFRFIWGEYALAETAGPSVSDPLGLGFTVPEKRRRITVRKFRGEWSEGLLLPISDFSEFTLITQEQASRYYFNAQPYYVYTDSMYHYEKPNNVTIGDDVSDLLGITHYDPDAGKTEGENSSAPKLRKKYPTNLKGWYKWTLRKLYGFFRHDDLGGKSDSISLGIPTYDVDALKNYPNVFQEGEQVTVTEKIHGSNARYIFLDGVMYAGSRNLWKSPNSSCIFRRVLKTQPWIEEWCRAHEGYVLWGEVTPTQAGYEYGSKEPQFFPFDIRKPDGKWLDSTEEGFM